MKRTLIEYRKNIVLASIGSFLVALSGVILYLDKVIVFHVEGNFGFRTPEAFLWVFFQSISPLILMLGFLFKPYKLFLLIPCYCYTVQLSWIFNPDLQDDDFLLNHYAWGSVIIFGTGIIVINYLLIRYRKIIKAKTSFLESFLDLSMEITNQQNKSSSES